MKKTRLVSSLMALAMSASVLGISASAADSVNVTVGEDSVAAGESFSVTVDLASVPSSGLNSIDFAIDYDETKLTISDVTLGSIGNTGAAAQEGDLGDTVFGWNDNGSQIILVWSTGLDNSQYWVNKSGTFVTITGKAKAGATGKAALEVVAADRAAYPGGAANKDILFSAVGADGTATNYTAAATAGAVNIGTVTSDTPADDGDVLYGDVDCDGNVNVIDAVLLARAVAEDATLKDGDITGQGRKNADVAKDGMVDSSDLAKLLNYLAGKIKNSELGK